MSTEKTIPLRHENCDQCYFKQNNQKPGIPYNECTLCLFNMQAPKTNNFKNLPTKVYA